MAGVGVFAIIFGAVTAWAGWTGRNMFGVLGATLKGGQQPAAGKNPFQDMAEGLPGLLGGVFSSAVSGITGGITGAVGGATGAVGQAGGDVAGAVTGGAVGTPSYGTGTAPFTPAA